jgi:hypothetical protein
MQVGLRMDLSRPRNSTVYASRKTFRASGYICATSGVTFGGLRTARSNRAALNWRSSSRLLHLSRMATRR